MLYAGDYDVNHKPVYRPPLHLLAVGAAIWMVIILLVIVIIHKF